MTVSMTPLEYLRLIAEWVRAGPGGAPMTWGHVAFASLDYAMLHSAYKKEPRLLALRDGMGRVLGDLKDEAGIPRLDADLAAAARRLDEYEARYEALPLPDDALLHERFLRFLADGSMLLRDDWTIAEWQDLVRAEGIEPEHFDGRKRWSPPDTRPSDGVGKSWQKELDELIGLEGVKGFVRELENLFRLEKMRESRGLPKNSFSLHLAFLGNPGTGKTSVARIVAKIYRDLGFLRTDYCHEVDRLGLVGAYVGHTAAKTDRAVRDARNGILFIDEAYGLADKGKDDFGHEAIEALMTRMENDRDKFAVIAAGYTDKMKQFLHSNPGLNERFKIRVTFDDYSDDELAEIFHGFARRGEYTLDPSVLPAVRARLKARRDDEKDRFGNARAARNLWEETLMRQATRVLAGRTDGANINNEALSRIIATDVPDAPSAAGVPSVRVDA